MKKTEKVRPYIYSDSWEMVNSERRAGESFPDTILRLLGELATDRKSLRSISNYAITYNAGGRNPVASAILKMLPESLQHAA